MDNLKIPTELIAPAFNPATFGSREAAHAIFTRLRRDYPLSIAEVPGYDPHWIVTKYHDIREITRQDELFHGGDRSKTLISQAGEALVKEYTGGQSNIFRTLVQLDPPEHGAYRAVLAGAFMPDQIGKLEPMVREIAQAHVAHMLELGPKCDFATEVAVPAKPQEAPKPIDDPKPKDPVVVADSEVPAKPAPDPKPTPTADPATAPKPTPPRTSVVAVVDKPVPADAKKPTVASKSGKGTLDVNCVPWCHVYVDGKDTGQNSPARGIALSPGKHRLKVVNPPSALEKEVEVEIRSGESATKVVRF